MKIVHVQKHPVSAPHLLARAFEYEETKAPVLPDGFEVMTVEAFDAWRTAELAGGWTPPAQLRPVPPAVTRQQLFRWLHAQGVTRDQLEAISDDKSREAALNAFDETQELARAHPLVAQLAEALRLSPEQVDEGFRAAQL